MNITATRILTITLLSMFVAACASQSIGLNSGFDAAIGAAERPRDDRARDANRKPKAVLEFVGVQSGMTVLDIAASTGWYSEMLSAAVGPNGRVIAQNGDRRRERSEPAIRAKAERLGNITVLYSEVGGMNLNAEADAAWTALNLHDLYNRSPERAEVFLKDIYTALKPGGVFGVIDHEGIAGMDNAALHRIEVSVASAALENAGFIVEAVSDILHNPVDDHTLPIRDPSLKRNTDRFVIRARKPR